MYAESAISTSTSPTTARFWSSPLGHAGTWALISVLTDGTSFFDSRIGAVPGVRAFVGQNGPTSVGDWACAPYTPVAASPDGGSTWAGAGSDCTTDWPGIAESQSAWNIGDFITCADERVLACCRYPTYNDYGYTVIPFLKSEDSGETFAPYTPVGLGSDQEGTITGLRLVSGRLLVVKEFLSGSTTTSMKLFISDDNGDTWSLRTSSPVAGVTKIGVGSQIVQLATGRIVYCCHKLLGTSSYPINFYSDNNGDTWSHSFDPIPGLPAGRGIRSAVAVGDRMVAGVAGNLGAIYAPEGWKPFRLSTDDGLTFTNEGTWTDPPTQPENGICRQMTVADDGAVIALLASNAGTTTSTSIPTIIWRGVLNAAQDSIAWSRVFSLDVYNGVEVACNHAYVYNIGVVSTGLEVAMLPVETVWELLPFSECPCDLVIVNDDDEGMTFGSGPCPSCSPQAFWPTLMADSERKSVVVPVQNNLIMWFINDWGARLTLVNSWGEELHLVTTGLILSKADVSLFGHYLGWTVKGLDPPYRLETVELQYAPTRSWDATP